MKKMFVVSLVLAAALAVGCKKQQPSTMPTTGGDQKTEEMKKEGGDMGGATYGGEKPAGGDAPADPCAAPN
jgi:hypothetical protein